VWERTFVHMRRSELTSSTNVVRLTFAMVCIVGGTEVVQTSLQRSVGLRGSVSVAIDQVANCRPYAACEVDQRQGMSRRVVSPVGQ